MKTSEKYIFCNPKSSGNTLVSLNMAICNQFLEQDKKIAYLQLSHFPDVHLYANFSNKRTIFDIKNFLEEKEFPPDLLSKIAQNNGVDCFQSPPKKTWKNFPNSQIIEIINILDKKYDILYLDISLALPPEILEYCFANSQKIIIVSFFDPPSLKAMEYFFDEYQKFMSKFFLLFNQCPKSFDSLIKKEIKKYEINYLGTLPTEKKYMWQQVFEALPLAFQKKSKWNQSLLVILKKIINS
jgi:hypothetical protein